VKEDSAQEQARVMAEEARRTAQVAQARADATGGEQEWHAQLGVIYGGLIGIAVLMVQPFLTATSLDGSAKISVIAFSVAIPLLAALVMVNRMEIFRRRWPPSVTVMIAKSLAQIGHLRRDRRRFLAHPVDRRGGIPSCGAGRDWGLLGRLHPPGNPRERGEVVEPEAKHRTSRRAQERRSLRPRWAALVMLNWPEDFRRRLPRSVPRHGPFAWNEIIKQCLREASSPAVRSRGPSTKTPVKGGMGRRRPLPTARTEMFP
jgi:hypothetical protein